MNVMIGYSFCCLIFGMYAANNDEIERGYLDTKLKLAYAGQWDDLWQLSNEYKTYQLIQASCANEWDKVKQMVTKHGHTIFLDAADYHGNFPLWCAVQAQRHDMIHFLLEHGANPNRLFKSEYKDVNALRNNGSTALFQAAYLADVQAALILLDAGAKHYVVNKARSTPLLAAVQSDCVSMVQLLIRRGANPNVQEKIFCIVDYDPVSLVGGDTPLIVAAKRNNFDMAVVLLAARADNVQAEDASGKTARSFAALHGNQKMFTLLADIKGGKYRQPECKRISFVQPNMWID